MRLGEKDKVKASKIITRIHRKEGKITVSSVLDEARKKTSPIHRYFEWSDAKAGDEYRKIQARRMIKLCWVEDPEGKKQEVFHVRIRHDDESKEGFYQTGEMLVKEIDQYQSALTESIKRADHFERQVRALKQLAEEKGEAPEKLAALQLAIENAITARSILERVH